MFSLFPRVRSYLFLFFVFVYELGSRMKGSFRALAVGSFGPFIPKFKKYILPTF